MWNQRERLSYYDKLCRSIYEILRESLERQLVKISLIDSYFKYRKYDVDYPFLDRSELKPKSKKTEKESDLFNTFIVIFCEGMLSPTLKNYIRFFPENSLVKKNLEYLANVALYKRFHQNLKYFDNPGFLDFIEELLNIDFALLIQQDPTLKKKNRYSLTHFHVKIDWPIADAAEDLAKELKYIQSSLYENGDKEARILQNKLFEYYGCHYSVGGRRTAGLIAAQLLRKMKFISTVFISSSESRSMYKYSESGVSKFFLAQFTRKQISALARQEEMKVDDFKEAYLYPAGNSQIGVAEAVYSRTIHSIPPEDGKLRKLLPAFSWLKFSDEFLHPKYDTLDAKPINYNWIYSVKD